jgi:hypothetical protein
MSLSEFTGKRSVITAWATLLLLFGLSGCGPSPQTPKGKLPVGTVDLPQPDQVLKGNHSFYGWAVSEDGIKSVELYIDRDFLAHAKLGESRPDVNKAFPGYPSGDNAGWRLDIDANHLPTGTHQMVFQAQTGKGTVGNIGTRTVIIQH